MGRHPSGQLIELTLNAVGLCQGAMHMILTPQQRALGTHTSILISQSMLQAACCAVRKFSSLQHVLPSCSIAFRDPVLLLLFSTPLGQSYWLADLHTACSPVLPSLCADHSCLLACCSFLGLLHMEVFHQRLEQEHGADVIATAPTVPFHIHFPDKTVLHIQNP